MPWFSFVGESEGLTSFLPVSKGKHSAAEQWWTEGKTAEMGATSGGADDFLGGNLRGRDMVERERARAARESAYWHLLGRRLLDRRLLIKIIFRKKIFSKLPVIFKISLVTTYFSSQLARMPFRALQCLCVWLCLWLFLWYVYVYTFAIDKS